MSRYYSYNEDASRPGHYGNDVRVNDPKDQAVVSKTGAAPKGYYMAGTQTVENKAGAQTYNIFRPLKIEETTTTTDPDTTDPGEGMSDQNYGVEPSTQPTNPYQNEIDKLQTQIGTISGQIGGYTETINRLTGQMETMQTNFGKQLETIMAANAKAMEEMNTQYQTQMRQQQEAQERARQQRELAAQTAAANQARAGQQADFQMGSGMMRGIFGGLAGFKRRGKVKASTSDALSIGATTEKSSNKMLNV